MDQSDYGQLWAGVRAARKAGEAIERKRASSLQPQKKGDGELVTEADHLAERLIVDELLTEYPDHNIVSEESSPEFTTKPRWIIDPIDGTTNYLNGVPHYAISIAFEGVQNPDVGVVYHVPTDTMFTAIEDGGAYANGHRISLSNTQTLSEALVVTGFDPMTMESQEFEQFQELLSVTQGVRRFGSAASEVAMVASGQFDAFFERMLSVWDTAAGVLLVKEAGGEVTRIKFIDGENSEMILASNSELHQDLVTLVSSGAFPK